MELCDYVQQINDELNLSISERQREEEKKTAVFLQKGGRRVERRQRRDAVCLRTATDTQSRDVETQAAAPAAAARSDAAAELGWSESMNKSAGPRRIINTRLPARRYNLLCKCAACIRDPPPPFKRRAQRDAGAARGSVWTRSKDLLGREW